MNKKAFFAAIIAIVLPITSVAQPPADKPQTAAKTTAKSEPQVQRWGSATLTMKDDKGNVILNRTEKYPIIDPTIKAVPFNNCWDWCRRVCDGYGVCWVSCGWACSPWTK